MKMKRHNLQGQVVRLETEKVNLENRIDNAINFIDQVLMYHLQDYKQLDEDINTLIGILRGSGKEC